MRKYLFLVLGFFIWNSALSQATFGVRNPTSDSIWVPYILVQSNESTGVPIYSQYLKLYVSGQVFTQNQHILSDGSNPSSLEIQGQNSGIHFIPPYIYTTNGESVQYLYFASGGYAPDVRDTLPNVSGTLTVTNASQNVSFGSLTLSGDVTGSSTIRGLDSFSGTAQHDTVTISGASVNDYYQITYRSTTNVNAADRSPALEPTATGFILHRSVGGTTDLQYYWFREK